MTKRPEQVALAVVIASLHRRDFELADGTAERNVWDKHNGLKSSVFIHIIAALYKYKYKNITYYFNFEQL